DFDPNAPGLASDEDRYNSAVYGRFEYGSAFKAISAAMALDAGVATEAKQYDARKPIRVGGHIIRDLHGKKRLLTFSEVVQYSSNIGMSRVAAELGPERQRKYLTDLNALDTLPIALKERRAPMPPGQWGPSENATVSFGHGIAVTSLHVLSSFSAVVNGGVYRTPGFLADGQQRPTRRVFSEETSHTMRRILRRVVTHGTASLADVPGYYPIGKTATADKPSNGGYDRSTRLSSFVGAFPGQAPKYAIMVTLDAPQPTKETQGLAVAGVNAAPTFARIASRLGPLFGEATVREREALRGFMERPANTIADAGRQDFNHVLASGVAADRSTVGSRTIAQAPLISGAPVARTQIASTQFASTQIETEQSAP
ncbi:MAG: penicillin-binding transpeptidase domain-containing protein, partial [Pseudomonadota bacterium]